MTSPVEWIEARDAEWAPALRRLSLVAELDLNDDDVEQATRYLGRALRVNPVDRVRRRTPAFFVVALTAVGLSAWELATFYRNVAAELGVDQAKVEQATREFHVALRTLSMPTFEEAGGMRWVTPVLLHGAVPLDHLNELLDLIAKRRLRDRSLDGESFVAWARLSPGALAGQPRALERFLLHSGDFAADYVSRVLDFTNGEPARLTRRVQERLTLLVSQGYGGPRTRRELRPVIAATPAGGFVLRLPPVRPSAGRETTWHVSLDGTVVSALATVPYRAGSEFTDGVSIGLNRPVRTITVTRDDSSTALPFVRREDPLLIFNDRGEFVPSSMQCPAGAVTLFWPLTTAKAPTSTNGKRLDGSEVDPPYGWDGWAGIQTTLAPNEMVRLGDGPSRRTRTDNRARLEEPDPVLGLRTVDGLPVLAERPVICLPESSDPGDWTTTLTSTDGKVLARFTPATHRTDALFGLVSPFFGEVSVEVRGPLGRGATRRFAIAEGITVDVEPSHRTLYRRGLAPAVARIQRTPNGPTEVLPFSPVEVSKRVSLGEDWGVDIEPPHTDFAVVCEGEPPTWGVMPRRLTPQEIRTAELLVRGLTPGIHPTVHLSTPELTQRIQPLVNNRRSICRFNLALMSDSARDGKAGTISLELADRVPVVEIRPPRLAERVELIESRLAVESDLASGLEVTVHRIAAAWEPGVVLPVREGFTDVPHNLSSGGPLRVRVRVANEWAPEPADAFPAAGRDTFDLLDVPWTPDLEPAPQRPLVAFILGDDEVSLPPASLARVYSLLADDLRLPPQVVNTNRLFDAVARDPRAALAAIPDTAVDSASITAVLVGSGLTAAPVADLALPDIVETLLSRSPVAAMLAASAAVTRPGGREAPIAALVNDAFGDEVQALWNGGGLDRAQEGRFESSFLEHPDMVGVWYRYLAPVPTMLLDADARTAAAYEMWEARRALEVQSRSVMPIIARVRRLVQNELPRLVPFIDARMAQDGVLALPVMSFCLSLCARLSAHGSVDAGRMYAVYRPHALVLARRAPQFSAIDLIRADAAITGAHA